MTAIVDGSLGFTAPVGAVYNGLQNSGSVATTSGTSITVTGIPSWVKRITVMLNAVSTGGTSNYWLQIGSGSVATTGYVSNSAGATNTGVLGTLSGTLTTAFMLTNQQGSGALFSGIITLCNVSGNIWIASGTLNRGSGSAANFSAGICTLGGALDRVAITTAAGDTFSAGSINVIYE